MNILKFRVWEGGIRRMDTVSQLLLNPNGIEIIFTGNGGKTEPHIDNEDFLESTVLMQFTGMLDKNGKEIYEGDIVKTTAYGHDFYREVKYSEESAMFYTTINIQPIILKGNNGMTVCGNIYENPELIKK